LEKDEDMVPFAVVDEYGEIQEIDNPKFTPVTYKLIKRAGFLPLTNELLKDTDQNILSYVTNWIAKKHVVTKNSLIIAVLNSLNKKGLTDIKAIKKVLNVDLDPAISLSSTIITNQDGFQWLDEQEDGNNRPLLQDDITQPGKKLFKGRPIVVVANRTLPSTGTTTVKAPFIVGNFKELMVLFTRGVYELASTNIGGDAWRRDSTELRTITRDDCVKWDTESAVFGQLTISTGA
jgi:HK97 family phage major capsid protein